MKLIFKFKRLISIAVLAVMMSTLLVVPALAYGMGGVTFRYTNGTAYAWGDIWTSGENSYTLNGALESTDPSDLQMMLYACAIDRVTDRYVEFPTFASKQNATYLGASYTVDYDIYQAVQADADFYVNGNLETYSYAGGWNFG